jgi:hypothetical protein
MKITVVLLALCVGMVAQSSTSTTQTDCTVNGSTANCTSTTQTTQQPDMFRAGQAIGQPLGQAIAYRRAKHWVKKYCEKNPGKTWWYSSPATGRLEGTCRQ